MTESEQLEVIFPGIDVDILDNSCKATVYPIGLTHLKTFGTQIATFANALKGITTSEELSDKDKLAGLLTKLMPYILEHLFDLVTECVVLPNGVDINNLPHWDFPPIVEAWVDASFGEAKKWKPWVSMIDSAIGRVTGEPFSLLAMFSES